MLIVDLLIVVGKASGLAWWEITIRHLEGTWRLLSIFSVLVIEFGYRKIHVKLWRFRTKEDAETRECGCMQEGSRTNIVGNVRYNRWLAALLQDERKKMDGCKRKFNDQVAPQKFFSSGYSGYARFKKEG